MGINRVEGAPRPLEGVRIVELANYMTVPQGMEILANMGAEVIKVESVTGTGDGSRLVGAYRGDAFDGDRKNAWYEGTNFNKNWMCLDFRTDEGKEVMHKLLATADLFATNYRWPALEKMGLDYDTLHKELPQLPMLWVNGYGENGPDRDVPGFEQAGFFARSGLINNITPLSSPEPAAVTTMVMGDTLVGLTSAVGAMIVLYESKIKGYGDLVTTGCLQTALWLQRWLLCDWQYGLKMPFDHNPSPTIDMFKCKDGKMVALCLTKADDGYNDLMHCLGRDDLIDHPIYSHSAIIAEQHKHAEFTEILRNAFAQFDSQAIVDELAKYELSADVCKTFEDVMEDPMVIENEFFATVDYGDGDTFMFPNCLLRTRDGGPTEWRLTQARGTDNAKYLKELGYSDETIEEWRENGTAPIIPTPTLSELLNK